MKKINTMKLILGGEEFKIELNNSILAKKITKKLPLRQEINGRYGDEIYSLTDFGLKLNDEAREIMEIGDVAYGVKSDGTKEAIVVFFGNTPAGDGTKPKPVSKCSVIGKIIGEFNNHKNIKKGDSFEMFPIV